MWLHFVSCSTLTSTGEERHLSCILHLYLDLNLKLRHQRRRKRELAGRWSWKWTHRSCLTCSLKTPRTLLRAWAVRAGSRPRLQTGHPRRRAVHYPTHQVKLTHFTSRELIHKVSHTLLTHIWPLTFTFHICLSSKLTLKCVLSLKKVLLREREQAA